MERRNSPTADAPEAVPNQPRNTFGYVGSDDYEYFEPPAATFERQRSPVPEYQPYETSPRVSAQSPLPPNSEIGRSPPISDSGFTKSRPLSPSVQYSEVHSPDPEAVYNQGNQGEKEAVYAQNTHYSKVPSYYASPSPGIYHQNSADTPQVWSDAGNISHPQQQQEKPKKRPFYKRWWFWLLLVILLIVIAVAVACGVVFGTKKSNKESGSTGSDNSSGTDSPTGPANITFKPGTDPDTSVGGYLSDAYYSKSGAFNGSGIAIAAADTSSDQSIYAFYQDSEGDIRYTLMDTANKWNLIGYVNADSYTALNGTPLSTVQHQLGGELVWHVFYIDVDYIIRERIISNTTSQGFSTVWTDGPISAQNLKTWEADTIGLQACYWGNYYGEWTYDTTQSYAGIHLWYASDSTTFTQYDWTNGTNEWHFEQIWPGLSGHGGVGCQTWDSGLTEYVWFVDVDDELSMYWRDSNQTGVSTTEHPINSWETVELGISNVQTDSSLGYTNYMVWQDQDTTIRGANITWGAENTTIADDGKDIWTLQYNGEDVHALRGTHLSITVTRTASGGAEMLTFFQEDGDEMKMYTRDGFNHDGLWAAAAQDPVVPKSS